ncbi:MAG TPA: DNA methyltransferase, partial [Draconibacterium sp.]|nr:DNA methyltransferase [Draconibacterium sp.]
PAIFGSMFQSVMNETERRKIGAHYTSEKNILKVIKPLFLDALWQEFHSVKTNSNKLRAFHKKVASLRFLDPACGCGNFLVITYRELRMLELAILNELQRGQMVHDISQLVLCDVDRFYGIEYEEFPAQIAQVALWLTDHQMNMQVSAEFGEYFVRLPLKKSAKITHGNALRTDWGGLVEPLPWETVSRFDYIFGNPPFVGKNFQNKEQKEDLAEIFKDVNGSGNIDYVTAWYIKAAKYLQENNKEEFSDDRKTRVAFVSTNSITQGEQVGILWNELFSRYHIKIHFAHRTFKWGNEAKANAAVHVVIVGFSNFNISEKLIFVYENLKSEPHEIKAKNINPYLTEGSNNVLIARSHPICNVPEMINGNKVVDGGNLILDEQEKEELLKNEPQAEKYIKMFIGSDEYINNTPRWCLYLKGAKPDELKNMPTVLERIRKVKEMREKSTKIPTQKWAVFPSLFIENRQPETDYLLIPRVSSENRIYVPIGYLSKDVIISDRATSLPNANLYTFGVIISIMHMTWMKYTCGRMKSDYNYSNSIVYNNFPWPENPTEKQKETIEKAAQKVLDVREQFVGSSLADLYNPITMPPELVKAHNELDKAVDLAYRPQPFATETKRIEFLFELYDKYTAGLFAVKKAKGHK